MVFGPIRKRLGLAKPDKWQGGPPPRAGTMAEARAAMIAAIEAEVRATAELLGKDRLDRRVMAALAALPREEFVPAALADMAHENIPLAIGQGQTISQPYIVAVMTDMLEPRPEDTILEIGTGSGYQAALLCELVRQVYSVEFLPELAAEASQRLARLGYRNIALRQGDGALGWPEHAPYDGIIVTAAAPLVPPALLDQLKPGRRMVIPVGERGVTQELLLIEKDAAGTISQKSALPVAFVPLV
jgi:protein-L-isoaspartate(D-aspartate) O-methyltransferase